MLFYWVVPSWAPWDKAWVLDTRWQAPVPGLAPVAVGSGLPILDKVTLFIGSDFIWVFESLLVWPIPSDQFVLGDPIRGYCPDNTAPRITRRHKVSKCNPKLNKFD